MVQHGHGGSSGSGSGYTQVGNIKIEEQLVLVLPPAKHYEQVEQPATARAPLLSSKEQSGVRDLMPINSPRASPRTRTRLGMQLQTQTVSNVDIASQIDPNMSLSSHLNLMGTSMVLNTPSVAGTGAGLESPSRPQLQFRDRPPAMAISVSTVPDALSEISGQTPAVNNYNFQTAAQRAH